MYSVKKIGKEILFVIFFKKKIGKIMLVQKKF